MSLEETGTADYSDPGTRGSGSKIYRLRYEPPAGIAPKKPETRTTNTARPMVLATFSWLETVYSLVHAEQFDAAIDTLFENIVDLASEQCELLLQSIDLKRLDTNLLVGLLSITLERATELPSRSALVTAVEQRLLVLAPSRVDGLLQGLR
jgi:hypothetical protein